MLMESKVKSLDYIIKPIQEIVVTNSTKLDITIPSKGNERDVTVAIINPFILPIKYDGDYDFSERVLLDDVGKTITGDTVNNTSSILDVFNDNSCVALYRFEGNANDESNNFNGTCHKPEAYTTGKFDRGCLLEDANYIDINSGQPNETTIAFWFKTLSSNSQCLFSQENTDNKQSFGIQKYRGNLSLFIRDSVDNSRKSIGSTAVADNTWYHIVITRTAQEQQLYINGKLIVKGHIQTYSDFSPVMHIGKCRDTNRYIADGLVIDQFRVFNKVLSDNEIISLIKE